MSRRRGGIDSDEDVELDYNEDITLPVASGGNNYDQDSPQEYQPNETPQIEPAQQDQQNGASFPVTLHVGPALQRMKTEEDEEYRESSSSESLSDSDSVSDSQDDYSSNNHSDTDFVVDSDGQPVKRRSYKRARRESPPIRHSSRLSSRRPAYYDSLSPPRRNTRKTAIRRELRDIQGLHMPQRREFRERKPVNYVLPTLETINADVRPVAVPKVTPQIPDRRLFNVKGPFGGSDIQSLINPERSYLLKVIEETQGTAPAGPSNQITVSSTADTDPLVIDTKLDFSAVGGLDEYIDKLKEMVSLPLMYPDIYTRFNITPPRGVLFHGPPGTGKTLMARALASSCQHEGKKITFFMRKGADILSKWVGEAERQLRLLFTEAKSQQPSIIFFDEIDGLAPVRSAKQEQTHASVVSTLLALMDGMDNRGQVVVIGATNRPDAVDPALRRPGRFDREFYFPLPDVKAREKILEIHTSKWDPPLEKSFVHHVANLTKGYGGADLRALCVEAALNAIQRKYPQIYMSKEKLLVDPKDIEVSASDFVKSLQKIIPSSTRSSGSASSPLPKRIEPLLSASLNDILAKLDVLLLRSSGSKLTGLEEALREDHGDFETHFQLQEFKAARTHRPRLLIHGPMGSGQEYIAPAVLNGLEGVFTQIVDLTTVFSNSMHSPEAALVQMLLEARKRAPSVLMFPDMDLWMSATSEQAHTALVSSLRSLPPTAQVLVVGVVSSPLEELDSSIIRFFGVSPMSTCRLSVSTSIEDLKLFYQPLMRYLESSPLVTMEPADRPKRVLPELPLAPKEEETGGAPPLRKENQARKDIKTRSQLKVRLGTLMDLYKNRYRRFRKPVIADEYLLHLFETVPPQVAQEYILDPEDHMILEVSSGRKYYNMDLDTIEDRLWNGYYCEPKQFLEDIERLHADSITTGDRDRIHKTSELLANAEVALDEIDANFLQACRELRRRDAQRLLEELNEQEIVVDDEPQSEPLTTEPLIPTEPLTTEPLTTEPLTTEPLTTEPLTTEPLIPTFTPSFKAFTQEASQSPGLNGNVHHPAPTNPPINPPTKPVTDIQMQEQPESQLSDKVVSLRNIHIDRERAQRFYERLCLFSQGRSLDFLESSFAALADIAWIHRSSWDRNLMLEELDKKLDDIVSLEQCGI